MSRDGGHLFISYAREDLEKVARLARLCTDAGFTVWWDRDHLPAGKRFDRVIDAAIRDAGCVLVCWSGAAVESDWVVDEAGEAKSQDKLLPVLLDDARPPYGFRALQGIDFTDWNGEAGDGAFVRLLGELRNQPLGNSGAAFSPAAGRPFEHAAPGVDAADLAARLGDPGKSPLERLRDGDLLARAGDPRRGVGIDASGLPDIDWIGIAGGEFRFGEEREPRRNEGFELSRYPLTHGQFQAFIDAGGYAEDSWWSGLPVRRPDPAASSWPQPNRPRGFVNWAEAMAFCRWFSRRSGYHVTLPTEEQWERAARGVDGRAYPWGDDYRSGFANVDEPEGGAGPYRLGQPSTVGMYPAGASPDGVQDLAGNVWEWCLNEYEITANTAETGGARRAVRGGAWNRQPSFARGSLRLGFLPGRRYGSLGFRIVRR